MISYLSLFGRPASVLAIYETPTLQPNYLMNVNPDSNCTALEFAFNLLSTIYPFIYSQLLILFIFRVFCLVLSVINVLTPHKITTDMKYSLILACVCPFFWSPMFAQPSKEAQLTKSTVNKATIEGHTYFIASDELRGRDTGSPEIDIAAKYLATTFRGYGVKPVNDKGDYFQQVKLEQRSAPSTLFVSFDGQSVGRSTQIAMVGLQNVALQGKGRYFASGNLDKAKKKKIEGHTLYFTRKIKGMGEVSQMFGEIETRKAEALKLGAVAVVEVVSMQEILWASALSTRELSSS